VGEIHTVTCAVLFQIYNGKNGIKIR